MMDLSKLTPAPWGPGDRRMDVCWMTDETDSAFCALARNAFDGDPEALAWWEANRKKRDQSSKERYMDNVK